MQIPNKGFISPTLILIITAVVALVLIVLFIFTGQGGKVAKVPEILTPKDSVVESLENVSKSDEVSAIEKDIDATDLSQLEQGLDQIDTDAKSL